MPSEPDSKSSRATRPRPRWTVLQKAPAAGTVTSAGVRIDDALFAVRSVGKSGERSIAISQAAGPPTLGVPPATVPPASPPPK